MTELKPLIEKLVKLAKRNHYWNDDDSWYSCPLAPCGCDNESAGTECDCGAEQHNLEVEKIEKEINQLLN